MNKSPSQIKFIRMFYDKNCRQLGKVEISLLFTIFFMYSCKKSAFSDVWVFRSLGKQRRFIRDRNFQVDNFLYRVNEFLKILQETSFY